MSPRAAPPHWSVAPDVTGARLPLVCAARQFFAYLRQLQSCPELQPGAARGSVHGASEEELPRKRSCLRPAGRRRLRRSSHPPNPEPQFSIPQPWNCLAEGCSLAVPSHPYLSCLCFEAVPSAFKAGSSLTTPAPSPPAVPRERPVTVDFSERTLLKPQRKKNPTPGTDPMGGVG